MARFTENNIEGFTSSELETMNAAIDRLSEMGIDDDMDRVSDYLNNAWFTGASTDDLVKAAIAHWGAH